MDGLETINIRPVLQFVGYEVQLAAPLTVQGE